MECEKCEYYDIDEGYCTALICTPISCDQIMPCECGETDGLTLMIKKGVSNEEDFDDFLDFIDDSPG